ncbi:MAG: DUF6778 family protein [Paracoccaceae bacterium]|nr:DUF6778 family protein [Paracoccaceae bacterium]
MKTVRMVVVLGLILGLGACATSDPVSRSAVSQSTSLLQGVGATPQQVRLVPRFDVAEIKVSVPQKLRVSEANMFYPIADIVWRGEPLGDRHAQIKAMFHEGLSQGTQAMTNGLPVVVEVEVLRFHALTEKTRYTIGGVHSIKFDLTVRDATNGRVIEGPRRIIADVKAAGGARAIEEERIGRTQRVVIVERLAQVIARELSTVVPVAAPSGVQTARSSSDWQLGLTPGAN